MIVTKSKTFFNSFKCIVNNDLIKINIKNLYNDQYFNNNMNSKILMQFSSNKIKTEIKK